MWRVWQVWQWCRLGYVPLLGLHTAATQFSPPPHPVGLGLPPFTVLFIIIPRLSHTMDHGTSGPTPTCHDVWQAIAVPVTECVCLSTNGMCVPFHAHPCVKLLSL